MNWFDTKLIDATISDLFIFVLIMVMFAAAIGIFVGVVVYIGQTITINRAIKRLKK